MTGKYYPDTADGAVDLLISESRFTIGECVEADCEPMGSQTWKVTMKSGKTLAVYVGLHPMAGDFETLD